ncbi:MAG: LemA family protein [Bdellovibrionales bacterium]
MEVFILFTIGVFVLFSILTYNSLVHKRANADNAFSGIDVQLTKRHDLLSKLIEVARQYMKYESETLQKIVKLREQGVHAVTQSEKLSVESLVTQELAKFKVTLEAYPQLQANANFVEIQRAMNDVEEQLAAARRTFNAAVTAYNVSLETFPSSLFANIMQFAPKALFVADEKKREDVDVKKLFSA